MYQKYQTDALVVGAREIGEADKTFSLLTQDFGLVRARATAVRKEASKMRYALQLYARANVSLVRGKRGWRLAGATALAPAPKDALAVAAFARVSELVMRLVGGEEQNRYLFDVLAGAHEALRAGGAEAAGLVEIVAVARVLYSLGYVSAEALETDLFEHAEYAAESLAQAQSKKDSLLISINRAIAQTHL